MNEMGNYCYFDKKKIFLIENPSEFDDWLGNLSPKSKVVIFGVLERKRDNVCKNGGRERYCNFSS